MLWVLSTFCAVSAPVLVPVLVLEVPLGPGAGATAADGAALMEVNGRKSARSANVTARLFGPGQIGQTGPVRTRPGQTTPGQTGQTGPGQRSGAEAGALPSVAAVGNRFWFWFWSRDVSWLTVEDRAMVPLGCCWTAERF